MVLLFFSVLAWPLAVGQLDRSHSHPTSHPVGSYLDCFAFEPSVREVQRAALSYARLYPSRFLSWHRRARRSAWLPKLLLRLNRGLSEDWRYATSGTSLDTDDNLHFEIRLRWDFNRLIFNRNELFVNRETTLNLQLRNELLRVITRLYFNRRKLQVLKLIKPPAEPAEEVRARLAIEKLSARLNALTGGFFMKQRARNAQGPRLSKDPKCRPAHRAKRKFGWR